MDANPLKDLTEIYKQQNLEQRLQAIEGDLNTLKGVEPMKLIELEVVRECGPYTVKKVISLNPSCIAFIESEDDNRCYIHTSDKTVLHILKSRDELLKLLGGEPNKPYTYIK